ncbi:MAG: GEVED domain-containing protein [Pirellulaceae bacterium]
MSKLTIVTKQLAQRRRRQNQPRVLTLQAMESRRLMAVGIWEGDLNFQVDSTHPTTVIQFIPSTGHQRLEFTDVDAKTGVITSAGHDLQVKDQDPLVLQPCQTPIDSIIRTGGVTDGVLSGDDQRIRPLYGYVGTFDGQINEDYSKMSGAWAGQWAYEACNLADGTPQDDANGDPFIEDGIAFGTWESNGRFRGDAALGPVVFSGGEMRPTLNVHDEDLLVSVNASAYWLDSDGNRIGKARETFIQQTTPLGNRFDIIRPGLATSRPAGAASIEIVVDESDAHRESNELNNYGIIDVRPTLAITNLTQTLSRTDIILQLDANAGLADDDLVPVQLHWVDELGNQLGLAAQRNAEISSGLISNMVFRFSEIALNRPVGSVALQATIDPENFFPEEDELDNQLTLSLQVDLQVDTLTLDSLREGISLNYHDENLIYTESVKASLYWAEADDTLLDLAFSVTEHAKNDGTFSVVFPVANFIATRPATATQLIAVLDPDDEYRESNEGNNTIALDVRGEIAALSLEKLSDNRTMEFTYQAEGLLSGEEAVVSYYWLDQFGTVIEQAETLAVTPPLNGTVESDRFQVNFATGVPIGATQLVARIDDDHRYNEQNESNNQQTYFLPGGNPDSIDLIGKLPDGVSRFIGNPGELLLFGLEVQNLGGNVGSANQVETEIYFSDDGALEQIDSLTKVLHPKVPAGETIYAGGFGAPLASNLDYGHYYAAFLVDEPNDNLESNETNNWLVAPLTVSAVLPWKQKSAPIDIDVTALSSLVKSGSGATTASVSFQGSAGKLLDAWIDYDGDGQYEETDEHIVSSITLANGKNIAAFSVPSTTRKGEVSVRVRLRESESDAGETATYAATVLDGLAAPHAGVDFPGNAISIDTVDDRLVVQDASVTYFSAPTIDVGLLNVSGVFTTNEMDLGLSSDFPNNQLSFRVPAETGILNVGGDDGVLDITVAGQLSAKNLTKIDLSDPSATRLVVDMDSISDQSESLLVFGGENDKLILNGPEFWRMGVAEIQNGRFIRQVTHQLTNRSFKVDMPFGWQNIVDPMDVDNSGGRITPGDALLIINELFTRARPGGSDSELPTGDAITDFPNLYFDTTGDGKITPGDLLAVLNRLFEDAHSNQRAQSEFVDIALTELLSDLLPRREADEQQDLDLVDQSDGEPISQQQAHLAKYLDSLRPFRKDPLIIKSNDRAEDSNDTSTALKLLDELMKIGLS